MSVGLRARAPWAVVLLLVPALGFAASYSGAVTPLGLVLAVGIPFGMVALGRRLGAGTFAPALLAMVLALVGAWLAVRGASTGSFGGLGDAVPRLLTTPRPAPATAALLAPTLLLVALVTAIVAACVLTPATTRVAGLLAPVLGALGLYLTAALLSAGHADPYGIVAVCLLVVIAAGWTVPYQRGGLRTGLRTSWRPASAVPLVVAVAVALAVGALAPDRAYDPRRHVTPPTVRLTAASPLSQLSSWTANPSVTILRARLTGTRRLHLATLTRFTGDSWQVDDRYRSLGLGGRGDLPAPGRRSAAEATVRIVQMAGLWLPAPGVPSSTSAGGTLVDADTGTLARPAQVRPGLTYDVRADVPNPTGRTLAVAAVPTDTRVDRYVALPGLPSGFATYARAAVRGASTPLEEAVALEHAVSTNRRVDAQAPTGSSYGRLQTFLFSPAGTAGAQVGTEEQFAASFAVLARAVGLPTRLVVGFLVPGPSGSTSTVHGRDATVWPEVYFSGVGWVPFAPAPGDGGGSADTTLRQTVLQRLSEQAAVLPVPAVRPPAAGAASTPARPHSRTTASDGPPWWVWVVLGVAALLVLGVLLVPALRVARSLRHRRAGAAGAWAEIVDLLVLTGHRPPASRPAPETALDAGLGPRGEAVARAADAAAFAPAAAAPGEPAGDLWRDVRVLRRRTRRALPRYRRMLLPLDPRPLRRG